MSRFEQEWERRLDERLRALPARRAPAALLSKVMAEAASREAARAGLFGRLPLWAASLGLATLAAGALFVLRLEAGVLSAAAGPWVVVARGLARALESGGGAAGAFLFQWRLVLAAVGAASLTACMGGTVAVGVLVGAGSPPWRTR